MFQFADSLMTDCTLQIAEIEQLHRATHNILYLELVWLQFSFSCFGSKSWHIGADGSQSFSVGIKNYGRYQTIGCAHCYTYIHHMIPARIKIKQNRWAQKCGQCDSVYKHRRVEKVSVLWVPSTGTIMQLHFKRQICDNMLQYYYNLTTMLCFFCAPSLVGLFFL